MYSTVLIFKSFPMKTHVTTCQPSPCNKIHYYGDVIDSNLYIHHGWPVGGKSLFVKLILINTHLLGFVSGAQAEKCNLVGLFILQLNAKSGGRGLSWQGFQTLLNPEIKSACL